MAQRTQDMSVFGNCCKFFPFMNDVFHMLIVGIDFSPSLPIVGLLIKMRGRVAS